MRLLMGLKPGRDNRARGDAARDLKDWTAAERHYRQHLTEKPSDADIWVQLGHCHKEQGQFKESEACYRRAIELRPQDPDPPLHLGHALKLQGRPEDALDAYRQSYDLAPAFAAASEIEALGGKASRRDDPRAARAMHLFVIDDLFVYLTRHKTMSGIQRVIAGIALETLSISGEDSMFCVGTGTLGREEWQSLWALPNDKLYELLSYVNGSNVRHDRILRLLDSCKQDAVTVRVQSTDTILVLGAFWVSDYGVRRYVDLKQIGARIGFYVYDIIPVTHPEYCDPSLVRDFTRSFFEMMSIADFVCAISEYTAKSIHDVIVENHLPNVPIRCVPLARLPLQGAAVADLGEATWPQELSDLRDKDYVVYVSTIEGRKNHAYVLNAWRALIEEGVDVPTLVFVGRMGWRVAGLMELLESTKYLGGKLRVVHDLSDGELDVLYRNCLFTTFTSFVEGWGLPVGESLAHGKVCVASNASSIPEVGGKLVDYVDPMNLRDGVGVFRRLIEDRQYRSERELKISKGFIGRSWKNVAADLLSAVAELSKGAPARDRLLLFPAGQLFRPGALAALIVDWRAYAQFPAGVLLRSAFFPPERFGAWMHGVTQTLRFATGLRAEEPLIVLLKLRAASGAADNALTVVFETAGPGGAGQVHTRTAALGETSVLRLEGPVQVDGSCAITIKVGGDFPSSSAEHHRGAIGLIAIGYARKNDALERLGLLESFMTMTASQ